MEHYKHSCPHCGQQLEYTRTDCGKSMVCPLCGKLVMFPAIPPGGFSKKLRVAQAAPPPKKKFEFKLGPMVQALFEWAKGYEHWRVVGFCLIPFVVIAVALIVATSLKRQQEAAKTEAHPTASSGAVDSSTWDKLDELAKADQQMQGYVVAVRTAKARVDEANRKRDELHNTFRGKSLDDVAYRSVMARYAAADAAITATQQSLAATRKNFDLANANYQKLGGKVDYAGQIQ